MLITFVQNPLRTSWPSLHFLRKRHKSLKPMRSNELDICLDSLFQTYIAHIGWDKDRSLKKTKMLLPWLRYVYSKCNSSPKILTPALIGLVWFYCIIHIVGYLTSNPVFAYILNIWFEYTLFRYSQLKDRIVLSRTIQFTANQQS